jgi:hypothetical protein
MIYSEVSDDKDVTPTWDVVNQDIVWFKISMSDLFAVQVVQPNEDHCEVIHGFIIREYLLFLHQSIEIATICKLSHYAELLSRSSLVDKLILVLDNKRMTGFLQDLELSIIPQLL